MRFLHSSNPITDNFSAIEEVYLDLLGYNNLTGCDPHKNEKELEPIMERFKQEHNKYVTYVW